MMPGPFATRADELRTLRKRTPRYRVPFPDLSVEQRTSACSDRVVYVDRRPRAGEHPDAQQFAVGHSHKQGLELITPGMHKHLEWMGGKKS